MINAIQRTLALTVLAIVGTNVQATDVNWGGGIALQGTNGIQDPALIIGFNPQPEPPGALTLLNMEDPTRPQITVSAEPGAHFFLNFAFYSRQAGAPFTFDAANEPNESGEVDFMGFSTAGEISVELQIVSSSNGVPVPGSWGAFNPQPEPPAVNIWGAGQGIAFEFDMTSLSDVTLSLRVLQQNTGEYVNFEQIANPVPVPPAIVLLPAALVALARYAKRSTAV